MGALVLILVLVVSQASASANRPTPADEKLQDVSDTVHLMSEEMIAQRDSQQKEIESRRLELTAIEDHIAKLVTELEHYREVAQAIEARTEQSESDRQEQKRKADELESKIEAEKQKLETLKAKAKSTSPAFAIFPYQGRNGTTRRPIYLECVQAGVIIQPEGTLVSMDDLKPPFGPGNPLDASLRLIRGEFQKLDPTSSTGVSPYPLLLVRPNGIKSYVLARAAMAGWDDQFGYELIDQNMPLAFPPTIPGLANQLETNLVIARERQIALAAAMPRRYAGGQPWEDDFDAIGSTSKAGSGGDGFGSEGGADGASSFGEDWTAIDSTFVRSSVQPSNAGGRPASSLGAPPSNPGQSPANNSANRLSGYQNQQQPPANATLNPANSNAALANNETSTGSFAKEANPFVPSDSSSSMQSDISQADFPQPDSGNVGADTGTNAGPSSGSQSHGSMTANQSSTMNSQTPGGASTSSTQGNTPEPAQPGQDPTQAYSVMTDREKAAMSSSGNAKPSDKRSDKSSNATSSTQPSTANPSPSSSKSQPKPQRRPRTNESSVAGGHNWSSRRYSPNSTAVSRPMNLVVMEDRWLVMRDDAIDKIETTIMMDKGPLEARNQLLQAISDRVDTWGVAVSEGYWQPKLTIEVTPRAELSAQRLQKLLEGSELDAEFVPLQSQKR
jgi:hypothetical protein